MRLRAGTRGTLLVLMMMLLLLLLLDIVVVLVLIVGINIVGHSLSQTNPTIRIDRLYPPLSLLLDIQSYPSTTLNLNLKSQQTAIPNPNLRSFVFQSL
jgi:hypothetical protein